MAKGQKQEVEFMWYATGNEGEELRKKIAIAVASANNKGNRFYLKPGNSALVTFLDTEGFYFNEHQLFRNGSWRNWYTCTRDFSECPLCESDRPSYVCAYTIIDHSKYTDKSGNEITNRKRLLVVKPSVMGKLARRREQCGGDFKYVVFEFARDSKDECSTGEDITFRKRIDVKDVLKFKPDGVSDEEWLKPFDYLELFKPLPVEELRKIAGQGNPVGYSGGNAGSPGGGNYVPPQGAQSVPETDINALLDDNVPF